MKTPLAFAAIFAALFCGTCAHAQNNLNTSGVRFWLERADAIRGPEPYGEDNYYNSLKLGTSSFRNFTANDCSNSTKTGTANFNCTHAIDGTAAWDATAAYTSGNFHINVLNTANGTTPSWAYCGQWLNSNFTYNGALYGFSHGENPKPGSTDTCGTNYGTHHKTMTLWRSSNSGLTWTTPVEVLDSQDSGTGETGEGDCTQIADTAYAYLFCRHPQDTTTRLARAPLSTLSNTSGMFTKYDSGWGSQPGINGADTAISGTVYGTSNTSSHLGSGVSYWQDQNWMMLLNIEDANFGGLKASFTSESNLQSNSVAFTTIPVPLFVQETPGGSYPYGSNPPVNLYIYPSVVSLVDGTRTWNLTQKGQYLLAYTFVPPPNTLSQRILAARSVTVTTSGSALDPQMLVEIYTRYDSTFNQRYSSTQPVAYGTASGSYALGSFSQVLVDPVAYLTQVSASNPVSQGQNLTKIVECRSTANWPSSTHPDRLLTSGSCDSNYTEDTVAGYTYPSKPAVGNSVQLYRCTSSANGTHWVANNSGCDGAGTSEKSLGWALTK
ncbi:MAG TPA: hypothetical protein VGI45_12775 [Terracidiphilus sp.]